MKLEATLYGALRESGVAEQHATAVVHAMEKEMTSVLATKTDLSVLRTELKADIEVIQNKLAAEIQVSRSEAKADNAALRAELKTDNSALSAVVAELAVKMDSFFSKVVLSFLGTAVLVASLAVGVLRYFK